MSKFMDATVRLYHIRSDQQMTRFFEYLETGKDWENTNASKIWYWACERWPKFPIRECEIRQEKDKS